MRKIKSGEGATDFGQSSGLSQDELLGRPATLAEFEEAEKSKYEGRGPGWKTSEIPKKVQLTQERIAELIHIELVKDEVSQGKIRSIGFMPSWIHQAAGVIVQEYQ